MSRNVNISTSPVRSLHGEQNEVDVAFLKPGGFTTSHPPIDPLDPSSTFKLPGEFAGALMPAMTEQPSRHKDGLGDALPCGRFNGNTRYTEPDGEWYELAEVINTDIPFFTVRYNCLTKIPLWYARYLTQGEANGYFKIVDAQSPARLRAFPRVEDADEDSEPLRPPVDEEKAALKQELANLRRKHTNLEKKSGKKADEEEEQEDDGKPAGSLPIVEPVGGTAKGSPPGGAS